MLVAILIGYLLGSVPFGLLLTKAVTGTDVRTIGSGNIGTTNVLRTGNKGLAAAVLLLDAGKAIVAGLLAEHVFDVSPLVGAAAALVGHCYPVWLKFKGGKGVATFFGGLALVPWLLLAGALTWLGVAFATRYSSLAALVTVIVALVVAWWLYPVEGVIGPMLVMAAVIIWRHRDNIRRLISRTEGKIGQKSA